MIGKQLSIRTILLLIISTLTLLIAILAIREVYIEGNRMLKIQSLHDATFVSDKLFETTEKFSMVRDITSFILYAPDKKTINSLRPQLIQSRLEADETLNTTIALLQGYHFADLSAKIEDTKAEFLKLKKLRLEVDKEIELPLNQRQKNHSELWFKEATGIILQTQSLWMGFIKHFSDIDPAVTLHMRFKHFLGVIMEYTGRERSLIGRLIVENAAPTAEEQAFLLKWRGAVEMAWERIDSLADQGGLSPMIDPYIKDASSHYLTVYDMVRDIFYLPRGVSHHMPYPMSVELWLEVSSQATDSMYELKNAVLKDTQNFVDILEVQAKRAIIANLVILCLSFFLCFYCLWIISMRVLYPINNMVEALINATLGNPLPLIAPHTNRQDEIGKLTTVLNAFQKNTEEIKRTSIMLERYTKDLERSNKELDDFAYIASHDLKEPLRGIHNHSRFLLEDNQDKLAAESVSRLGRLIYLSQRMEKLVNDLLYFSRLGRQELAIRQTDMNEVVKDIENTLDVFLAEHKAKILVPKKLPTITCDTTSTTEAFRNLITNAIKYNDKENKIIEIGLLDRYESSDWKVIRNVFYIKDNGNGIAKEFYGEIFRIFKRLQSSKNKEDDGTGAGLTFVKKIIERHGGKIWLESEISKGTTFYFTLEG